MVRTHQTIFAPGGRDSDWYLDSLLEYVHQTRAWVHEQTPTPASQAIESLLSSFMELAVAYYQAVVPTVQAVDAPESQDRRIHQAIEKLTDEWMQIIPAIQIAAFDTNAPFYLVGFLVKSVYQSLQLDAQEITVVPSFGRHFHLVKFRYAPNVALVSMPVFALQTPWEWSVLWHELATLVIAKPAVSEWIAQFVAAEEQASLWSGWKALDAEQPDGLAADQQPVHPVDAVVIDHIGIIDRTGWIEEMIEDACSILVLGPVAYRVLHTVLAQRNEQMDTRRDTRHPPPNLRLEVAYQLLRQMANEAAEPSLAMQRLDHGRYANDQGAAQVAQWIWYNKEKLVKITFDWAEAADDQENIVQTATRSIIERQIDENTPLARAAQYASTRQASKADDDTNGVIGLLRRIISDGRQVLDEPSLGKIIYNQATDLLTQWLQLVNSTLGKAEYSPSQAQAFIAANIQEQPWSELEKLIFSSVDHMNATLVSGGHAAGSTPAITVTVSGYTHNQYHESTYVLSHPTHW